MSAFDPDDFELAARGHDYDDFEIGATFEHHWGRTLTAADNVLFCSATCNWNPLYLDAEYARAHGHPDVVLNPYLVLATVLGLSVEDLSERSDAFLGMEACRFLEPLHPGDTVRASSVVLAKRLSASRPGRGTVTWRTTGRDQRDRVVLEYERTNLLRVRTAATGAADAGAAT